MWWAEEGETMEASFNEVQETAFGKMYNVKEFGPQGATWRMPQGDLPDQIDGRGFYRIKCVKLIKNKNENLYDKKFNRKYTLKLIKNLW